MAETRGRGKGQGRWGKVHEEREIFPEKVLAIEEVRSIFLSHASPRPHMSYPINLPTAAIGAFPDGIVRLIPRPNIFHPVGHELVLASNEAKPSVQSDQTSDVANATATV